MLPTVTLLATFWPLQRFVVCEKSGGFCNTSTFSGTNGSSGSYGTSGAGGSYGASGASGDNGTSGARGSSVHLYLYCIW